MNKIIGICLLLLEIIVLTSTTTSRANKLIQNICDTLKNSDGLELDEDQQWKTICEELFAPKDNEQYVRKQRDTGDEEENIPLNSQLRKAAVGGGGVIRGIRGGGGGIIRTGGGGRPSSITRFHNTQTGTTISRPNGWQWSRTRLIFLPIAAGFLFRSRSASNRYTTPSTSSLTYYYCTSVSNDSDEIQCNSANGDKLCCEDELTGEAFCCGGNIPNYILQDMNRATQTAARIFYTLAVLALCMHLFMRHFHR